MHRFSEQTLQKGQLILSKRYGREVSLDEANEILGSLVSYICLLGSIDSQGGEGNVRDILES